MDYDFTFRSTLIQQAMTPPGLACERLDAFPPEDIDRLLAFPGHDSAFIARRR
jgi:hypothetical protein